MDKLYKVSAMIVQRGLHPSLFGSLSLLAAELSCVPLIWPPILGPI